MFFMINSFPFPLGRKGGSDSSDDDDSSDVSFEESESLWSKATSMFSGGEEDSDEDGSLEEPESEDVEGKVYISDPFLYPTIFAIAVISIYGRDSDREKKNPCVCLYICVFGSE